MRLHILPLIPLATLLSAPLIAEPTANAPALPPGATVIQSRQLLIAVSPTHRRAYAFSHRTGEVSRVRVDAPSRGEVIPVVGDSVGCFVVGTKAYAYGADSGVWGVMELGAAAVPTVSTDLVRIDVGARIYLFSSTSKAWQVIDLSRDEE